MLISGERLIGVPILSVQETGLVARTERPIIEPESLKIIGFVVAGAMVQEKNILDISSVREFSRAGMVIDAMDELVEPEEVIKIKRVLELNFELVGLKVETKKGSKLGRVTGFVATDNDFMIQQIIVRRPAIKALIDPELTIPRSEILEIDDYKIIVKDEEKMIRAKAEAEFVQNFVNPFRKSEPDFAPVQNQSPDESNTA